MTPTPVAPSPIPISYSIDIVSALTLVILLVVGTVFVALLIRNGWRIRDLKRIKFGEVEVERDTGHEAANNTDSKKGEPGDVSVSIKHSKFKGDVGDIGGIIIKNDTPDNKPSDDPGSEHFS